jgi:hypothetical protein
VCPDTNTKCAPAETEAQVERTLGNNDTRALLNLDETIGARGFSSPFSRSYSVTANCSWIVNDAPPERCSR